jgi:hypothetical protein
MLGLVLLHLAGYYLVVARNELTVFFQASVAGRVVVRAGPIVMVALWGCWTAVVFGLVDIAGALWTRAALADNQPKRQATPAGPAIPSDGQRGTCRRRNAFAVSGRVTSLEAVEGRCVCPSSAAAQRTAARRSALLT